MLAIGVGASRRVTALFSISKSLLLMPVGMGTTVSISPFPDLARGPGEAASFGTADPCPPALLIVDLPGRPVAVRLMKAFLVVQRSNITPM
jgi:hypothetical protein